MIWWNTSDWFQSGFPFLNDKWCPLSVEEHNDVLSWMTWRCASFSDSLFVEVKLKFYAAPHVYYAFGSFHRMPTIVWWSTSAIFIEEYITQLSP